MRSIQLNCCSYYIGSEKENGHKSTKKGDSKDTLNNRMLCSTDLHDVSQNTTQAQGQHQGAQPVLSDQDPYESSEGKTVASALYIYLFLLLMLSAIFAAGVVAYFVGILILAFLVCLIFALSTINECGMILQAIRERRQTRSSGGVRGEHLSGQVTTQPGLPC
jgi:hypothetical protein